MYPQRLQGLPWVLKESNLQIVILIVWFVADSEHLWTLLLEECGATLGIWAHHDIHDRQTWKQGHDSQILKDSGILTIPTLQNAYESCNLVNNPSPNSIPQLYFQMKLLSPWSGQMRRSSVLVCKTLAASSRWRCFLLACPRADGKIRSKGLKGWKFCAGILMK